MVYQRSRVHSCWPCDANFIVQQRYLPTERVQRGVFNLCTGVPVEFTKPLEHEGTNNKVLQDREKCKKPIKDKIYSGHFSFFFFTSTCMLELDKWING